MRRRTFIICLLLTVFLTGGLPASVAQRARLGSLAVFDVQPAPARQLGLKEAVSFHLNRRVDCAQARGAFSLSPAIAGELACDEYTLTFSPAAAYERDTAYTFVLAPPLNAKDGAPLLEAFRATFKTVGHLEVVEALPGPNAELVPVDSAITVVFDRPVAPLAMSTDADELPHPVALTPATAGNGEWVNSAIYVFKPSAPLQSAAEYRVTVAGDLLAVDGATLSSAVNWSFKTEAPSITSVYPRPRSDDLLLDPKIHVRFNQVMERREIERAFYFRAGEGRDAPDITGEFEWAEDGKGFAFAPDERLQPETGYRAGFDASQRFRRSQSTWSYTTVPLPAIVAIYPADGDDDVRGGGVSLRFASRMKLDTLPARIHIEPAPEAITRTYYSYMNERYDLYFEALPSTEYRVRIEPGMEDIYGNVIGEELNFSFTSAPLPPRLRMNAPGPVGFYNAYRGPTQLYVNYRGLSRVDVALHHVPLDEFVRRLSYLPYWEEVRIEDPEESELLSRWTLPPNLEENRTRYELLQLGESGPVSGQEDEGLPPGVYFLEMSSPSLEQERMHYLNVSTAALTVKHTSDRLTVWALDVESGAPIAGEPISVYGQDGNYLRDVLTDERGIALADIQYTPEIFSGLIAVLNSNGHFGISYSTWTDGMAPWDFDINYSRMPSEFATYLYTDRPVYRTGQPVYFRGIVRSKDDVVYMPAPFETIQATLRDSHGDVVDRRVLPVSDFGSFHGQFDIAPRASLGRYSIAIDFPNSRGEYRWTFDRIRFLVAEYRLPEYQVSLETERPDIVQGETATFELSGKYFFGGPVSQAEAEYTVQAAPFRFNYTGDGYYDFSGRGSYSSRSFYDDSDSIIAEGALKTDAAGVARFDLAGELPDDTGSQRWRVEAAIRDEAGQEVFGHSELTVHQGLLYVGARAQNYVGRVGQDSVIKIIAVDWDSQPIPSQEIDVQVLKRTWTYKQEQDPISGRVASVWQVEEIPVTGGSVRTGADGKARFVFQPPSGGAFDIVVSTRDKLGKRISASTRTWVSSSRQVSWRQNSDHSIDLIPARKQYRIGDTAEILIASPFEGAVQALVSIERGDVLSTELITLESNSHIHEFEIQPNHAPNIFVSVFIVKPAGADDSPAAWRMGITELQVDPERKALNIAIEAEPAWAEPQAEVEFRLRVTDYKGEPVRAEVGLGLTDLAALSLGEHYSGPILDAFFGRQALSVYTSSALLHNADAITASLVPVAGKLEAMQDMRDCCFGGGGAPQFQPTLARPRSEFVDTPYWNPTMLTDAAGEATVKLRLPDNLTTWRLDARAITEARDGRFLVGETSFDLPSTRPLLIRPVTPRFFIVGDQAQIGAIVNNNTGRDISASVAIENVAGLIVLDDTNLVQQVMIPAGGRQRVNWRMRVADVESVAPIFRVRSADFAYSDASVSPVSADAEGSLPVYRYDVPETVGSAGMLRAGGARIEAFLLPRDFDVGAGRLDIRLEKSLAGVTNASLGYLEGATRRYGDCTATIVSRFLPNIYSYRAIKELGLVQPDLESKLDALVTSGLRELQSRQQPNGGWNWCAASKSHAPTTAYALIGLAAARAQGYPADETVIRQAQNYLRSQLFTPTLIHAPWRLNRQAFLLYALAYSGAPDLPRSRALFNSRARMNLDAIAFLAMTLHRIDPADHGRLDALTQMMFNRAVTRASGTFFNETYLDRWNWSTDIRSTALVLNALVELRPESELLPNTVRHLVSARQGRGRWSSLQENAWSIIALTNWMSASGELKPDYTYSLAMNGRQLFQDEATPGNALASEQVSVDLAQLIQRESNLMELQRSDGAGALYYSAHMELDLPVPAVRSFSRGVEISRRYTRLGDAGREPITGASVGDTLQVRLTIVAPNTLRYVVIEDFFPAGAEAINPDLAISQQIGTRPGGERVDAGARGWGWWHFDHIEFHDEKAVIYASVLPRGVYEFVYAMRATILGRYNVIPPTAQELHFPEVYGRGDGMLFTISE